MQYRTTIQVIEFKYNERLINIVEEMECEAFAATLKVT